MVSGGGGSEFTLDELGTIAGMVSDVGRLSLFALKGGHFVRSMRFSRFQSKQVLPGQSTCASTIAESSG